mgnify:CR=1 FL=1
MRSQIRSAAGEQRTPKQAERIAEYYRTIAPLLSPIRAEIAQLERDKAELLKTVPTCLVSTSGPPRVVKILVPGNVPFDLRCRGRRKLVVQPGGVVPFHSHDGRPALGMTFIGANAFIDMLDTQFNNQFWQLGVGIDAISGATVTVIAENQVILRSGIQIARQVGILEPTIRPAARFTPIGEKLGWSALVREGAVQRLTIQPAEATVTVNGDTYSGDSLQRMPGFDKNHWPDTNDHAYYGDVDSYWGTTTLP